VVRRALPQEALVVPGVLVALDPLGTGLLAGRRRARRTHRPPPAPAHLRHSAEASRGPLAWVGQPP
jgi:hypothetical protein